MVGFYASQHQKLCLLGSHWLLAVHPDLVLVGQFLGQSASLGLSLGLIREVVLISTPTAVGEAQREREARADQQLPWRLCIRPAPLSQPLSEPDLQPPWQSVLGCHGTPGDVRQL